MENLVILHGWGSCAENWREIKEVLQREDLQVLTPDLPGFGVSTLPKRAWFVDDYVEWLKGFCEKQNVSRFFLFGHSFGGRIAIKFAAQYPEKLKGLILCSAAGIKPKNNLLALAATKAGKIVFSLPLLKGLYPFFQKVFYVKILRKTDYLKAQGIMKQVFKNVVDEDLTPCLSQIKVPTLILWGRKDKMTPVKDGYLMKEKISSSQLKVFDNVGHSFRRENPKLLIREIGNFVR